MAFFLFGKKRRTRRKASKAGKKTRKPPAAILKKCRKLKIKTTKKVGSKRVYRSISLLKKLIKNKSRKSRKTRKVHRKVRSKFSFGSSTFTNAGPSGYGYNQQVVQNPGILSQSSMIVTPESNLARPAEMQLPLGQDLAYGVGRNFFTETVPTQIAPNWNVMRQPDGSAYGVGGPFSAYKSPAFGRRKYAQKKTSKKKTLNKRSHFGQYITGEYTDDFDIVGDNVRYEKYDPKKDKKKKKDYNLSEEYENDPRWTN